MSWFILISASLISAAIIIYALWPSSAEHYGRKKWIILGALLAFLFPIGLNYYLDSPKGHQSPTAREYSGALPEIKKSIWSGGTETLSASSSPSAGSFTKDMSMSGVTSRLEEKLKKNPENINGWILLGRSYAAMGQSNKAVDLFKEKVAQYPNNKNLLLSYGETLTQINQGVVTAKAAGLFTKALKLTPAHPRAEYNLALHDMQNDRYKIAYSRLKALMDTAPEGAKWTVQIRERLDVIEKKLGLPSKQAVSPSFSGPTPEQISSANSMSQEDRTAFINSMVTSLANKLKENPNDLQGWVKLGKSYGVLQQWQKSAYAYQQAVKLAPSDSKIKALYEGAKAKAEK